MRSFVDGGTPRAILASLLLALTMLSPGLGGPQEDTDGAAAQHGAIEARVRGWFGAPGGREDEEDWSGYEVSVVGRPDRVTTTDEDGAFQLFGLPAGEHLLRARGTGGAEGTTRVTIEAGERLYCIPLRVGRGGGVVEGRLVLPDGLADRLPSLEVRDPGNSSRSDVVRTALSGRFRLGGLPEGRYELLGRGPGRLVSEPVPIEVVAGEVREIDIPLGPGEVVDGRVVDRDGRPVPKALVFLTEGGPGDGGVGDVMYTRGEGRFDFQGLVDGDPYVVRVRHPGLDPVNVEVTAPASDLEIELPVRFAVRCRVIDGQGRPVDHAAVELIRPLEPHMHLPFSNRRSLRGLGSQHTRRRDPPERFRLGAVGPGFVRTETDWLRAEPDEPFELSVILRPGLEMTGRVLDGRGEPLTGARIFAKDESYRGGSSTRRIDRRLRDERYTGRRRARERLRDELARLRLRGLHVSERTGGDGTFTIDGLPPGPLELDVHHPERFPVEKALEVPEEGSVEARIHMPPLGAVHGRVVGPGVTVATPATVGMRPVSQEEHWAARIETDRGGRFRVPRVPAGLLRVRVKGPDGRTDQGVVRVRPGRTEYLYLPLD